MGSLHVRFSAVLCVLAILSFQNVNPVENWNVFSSEKGEFKWAKFCDWEGNNFDEIQDVPIADSCGKICLADLKCTHFSWVDETCFLKEITPPVNETPFQEVDRCGFVVNRKTKTSPDVRTITPTTTSVATSTKTHTASAMKSTSSSTTRRSKPTTKHRRIYSTPFVYPAPKPTTPLPESKKALNVPYEHSRIKWTSLSGNVPFIPYSGGKNVYKECAGILPDCNPQGSVIDTFYTPHLQDCTDICLTRTGCTKFSWKKTRNGACYLTNDLIINPAENPYQGIFYRTPDQIVEEPCIGGSTIFKHRHHQTGESFAFVLSTTEQTTSTRTVAPSSTKTTRPTTESTIQTTSQSPPSTTVKQLKTTKKRRVSTPFVYPEIPSTESTIQTTSQSPPSTTVKQLKTTKKRRVSTPFAYPEIPSTESTIQTTSQKPPFTTVKQLKTTKKRHVSTPFVYPEIISNTPYEDRRIKWERGPFYQTLVEGGMRIRGREFQVPPPESQCRRTNTISTLKTPLLRGCVDSCLSKTWCNEFTWDNGLCYLAHEKFTGEPSFDPFYYARDEETVNQSCIRGSLITKHHNSSPRTGNSIGRDSSSNTLVTITTAEKPAAFKSLSPSAKVTTLLETSIKGPEINWASKCEFTTKEECGKLCLTGPRCTHFLWIKGICFLNAESKTMPMTKTNHEEEPACGYVANRNEKPMSEQIIITSKDTREVNTVATLAPTPPITTLTELELPPSTSKTTHKTKKKTTKKQGIRIPFG